MPTVLRIGPYRFFFYSQEGDEPPHIHIEDGDRTAKYWLTPVELAAHAVSVLENSHACGRS